MRKISYKGQVVEIVCNGGKNTRIRYFNGRTELVPNDLLFSANTRAVEVSVQISLGGKPQGLEEVRAQALKLMEKYGLLAGGWRFEFDEAKKRAGLCSGYRKTISLSRFFASLNSWEEILNMLLHEIAHALVGCGHGHDGAWKNVCRQIGARPERCYDSASVNMPQLRYVAVCGGCGARFSRDSCPEHGTSYHTRCGPVRGELIYRDTRRSR